MSDQPQNARLFLYLSQGLTISQYEATVSLRITNLSQRVHELRKEGHNIVCEFVTSEDGVRYGRYRLLPGVYQWAGQASETAQAVTA